MFLITWRGIRQHPVRFLLSALAVVLGVAFITGTLAFRTSLSGTFDAIVSGSYSAAVYVQPADASSAAMEGGGSAEGVPMSLDSAIDSVDGVEAVVPSVEGTGVLIGRDGTPVTTSGAPTLMFADLDDSPEFAVVSGRMPERSGEIALESSALASTGFAVGDTTKIVVGGEVKDVTIVGDVSYSSAVFGAILVVLDRDTGIAAFAPTGAVASIGVRTSGSEPAIDMARRVAEAIGSDVSALDDAKQGYRATLASGAVVDVRTGDSLRADLKSTIDGIVGFISVFLLIFAAIALFVGGFIIANTFTMQVRQRMREIAVLRAIGASPLQVFLQVVGQAVFVGVAGSVVGIAAGMGLVGIVRNLLEAMGSEMSSGVPLTTETVVVSLAAGVLVSVISAAIPARRAASIPPVAAMRDDVASESRLLWRGIVGAVLVIAGIVLALVGATRGGDGQGLLGVGAVLVAIGALVVAPAIVAPVIGVLAWPLAMLWKPIGVLARGNVTRNARRTASTASALMIGMALVGGCAVLAASAQASVSSIVVSQAKADFLLMNAVSELEGVPAKAESAVRAVDGIGRMDTLYFGAGSIAGAGTLPSGGTSTYFVAASPKALTESFDLPMTDGSAATVDHGDALVRESVAKDYGLRIGDRITVSGLSADAAAATAGAAASGGGTKQSADVTIGGIYSDDSFIGARLILPVDAYEAIVPEQARVIDALVVTASPGTDVSTLGTALKDAVKPFYVISVQDKDELVSQYSNQISQVLTMLYALLALSIIIAILGIVNTLALSVIERTREIGLTRAVGLGRLQLAATIMLESVYIAVFGALLGLAMGVGLASLLPSVIGGQGFNTLAIPWPELGWMLLLSAAVGVVAAVWPAIRAARMPVLASIASE